MKRTTLYCIFLTFAFALEGYSQFLTSAFGGESTISKCDFCLASQGISPVDAGSSGVRYDFRYLRDQDFFRDGKRIDTLHSDMETYVTHQISLYMKINERLSASVLVPFSSRSESGMGAPPRVIDMVKAYKSGKQEPQHNGGDHAEDHPYSNYQSGLSDIMLIGRYKIVNDMESSFIFSAIGGVMLPTGTTNAKDYTDPDSSYLNPHMQLGTGAVVPLVGISALYGKEDYSLSSGVLASIPGVGAHNYQFGKNVNYDLTFHYSVMKIGSISSLLASIGMMGEWHSREKNNGVEIFDTGGNTTYLSPGVQFLLDKNISFEASYQYPFIHALNGKQLGESYRFTAGTQYLF